VQQLQFFLSEADWDAVAVTTRRIELLRADALTTPHAQGALVIDETGDRKDGTHTAHVAHQYLGSIGKIANGIVAVTSLWADARVYYPLHALHVRPYTCGPTRRQHASRAASTTRHFVLSRSWPSS
jgi:SRSO17 transposase